MAENESEMEGILLSFDEGAEQAAWFVIPRGSLTDEDLEELNTYLWEHAVGYDCQRVETPVRLVRNVTDIIAGFESLYGRG